MSNSVTAQKTAKPLSQEPIPVRRMDFKFPALPRYWFNNNSWISHYVNALSTTFPDGERFFIHSVRYYENRITDPMLKARVKAFIGQEAHHGKEHEAFNQALKDQHNIPLMRIMRIVRAGLERVKENTPPRWQLALTVSAEHFTAIMAHQLLKNREILDSLNKEIGDLLLWHSVEEIEHKSVAFDVYQTVDGSYPIRSMAMMLASLGFIFYSLRITYHLIRNDKKLTDWRSAIGFANFLLNKPGFFIRILPEYIDFYRRDFDPRMHKDHDLIVEHVKALMQYEIKSQELDAKTQSAA